MAKEAIKGVEAQSWMGLNLNCIVNLMTNYWVYTFLFLRLRFYVNQFNFSRS